jgi:hypothetical protein
MRRFLASNSLAILSLIAIKNSQRESREGQGARVHQSSFCPGARGWPSPALTTNKENMGDSSVIVLRKKSSIHKRQTRVQDSLQIPLFKTTSGQRSFVYIELSTFGTI